MAPGWRVEKPRTTAFTSNYVVYNLLHPKAPLADAPLIVDVRDVALAHANAMERPEAGGKRFFVVGGHYGNREIAEVARKHFGTELADRLPAPDTPGGALPPRDQVYGFDNSRATEVLGIQWTPFEKSIVDTINSVRELGAF